MTGHEYISPKLLHDEREPTTVSLLEVSLLAYRRSEPTQTARISGTTTESSRCSSTIDDDRGLSERSSNRALFAGAVSIKVSSVMALFDDAAD